MKVVVLKGKFIVRVIHGTLIQITCNVCTRAGGFAGDGVSVPGKAQIETALSYLPTGRDERSWRNVKQQLERERDAPHPNAMATMIVAPVSINGRASGCQPVVCFYCQQVGLISVEAERGGVGPFGFQPRSLNEDTTAHARRRCIVTFTTLLALDNLVCTGAVARGSTVVCAGASLQCQGKKSRGHNGLPKQDAHQILRELSINGHPLYQLVQASGLHKNIKDVVTYFHGAVSHLDSEYNEADCLVERHVAIEMVDLAHMILNGHLRAISGSYDQIFGRLLWGYVMARYRYAIAMALIDAPHGAVRDILIFYKSIVDRMFEEGAPDLISHGLSGICEYFLDELRAVVS
ncbi:MAG: hypothetical protein WA777_10205 [Rhodanobacter sp.]